MLNQTMSVEEQSVYEEVAGVVGAVMDNAFKEILVRLGNGKEIQEIKDKGVDNNKMALFFEVLDNAAMDISFSPTKSKESKCICWENTNIMVNGFEDKWSGEIG
ncbi:MAG: hypothetical protein K8R67_03870 [Desulfobacteraceae bacterium]|nr:hypothetical protein [Desulfobacteraceae bacterium]